MEVLGGCRGGGYTAERNEGGPRGGPGWVPGAARGGCTARGNGVVPVEVQCTEQEEGAVLRGERQPAKQELQEAPGQAIGSEAPRKGVWELW